MNAGWTQNTELHLNLTSNESALSLPLSHNTKHPSQSWAMHIDASRRYTFNNETKLSNKEIPFLKKLLPKSSNVIKLL